MPPTAGFTLTDSLGNATLVSGNFIVETEESNPLGGRKIWLTQQVSSKSELTGYRLQIANCKQTVPAITGLSLRMPWNLWANDKTILDLAKQYADENSLEFCFRPMAGRWTPLSVLTAMGTNYTFAVTAAAGSNSLAPKPFSSAGVAGNPVFEAAYEALLRELADWYVANDCYLLHNTWHAMDWAELNNGAEVRATPGYTQQRLIDGCKKLIVIGAEVAADYPDIVMEWPLSGYGPLTSTSGSTPAVSPALADSMVENFGSNQLNCVIQANGWSNSGQWGTTAANDLLFDPCWNRPLAHGLQAIQPWGVNSTYPQYTASQIAQALDQARVISANYLEIYLPSLRSVNNGALWATPLLNWKNGL